MLSISLWRAGGVLRVPRQETGQVAYRPPMSPHLLGLIGAALVGTCGVLTALEYSAAQGRAAPRDCQDFAARPTAGWVTLVDCELDFEHAVVSDEVGHERLVDRIEGISRKLHDAPPTWSQVLVPLSSPRPGPARAMVALSDAAVLTWLNGLERRGVSGSDRSLQGIAEIQRWRRLGRLQAEGVRDRGELQRVMGPDAIPGLVMLRPAVPPPAHIPSGAMALGVLGLGALAWRWAGRDRRGAVGVGGLDVSDVKLELGELASLERDRGEPKKGPE